MEIIQVEPQSLHSPVTQFMNSHFFSTVKPKHLSFISSASKLKPFCTTTSSLDSKLVRGVPRERIVRPYAKVADVAQLKEDWLDSLTNPFPRRAQPSTQTNAVSNWVLGIDPDISGALALLKTDESGCPAQVFDSPCLKVTVGKRIRKRLDAKSIVQLLNGFDAPIGTVAYLEQSIPYPKDGKQGWWAGGFGYGLWIGILVASGFSVVPVPSFTWKNEFKLSGGSYTKDDSRRTASILFPSLSSLLKRKKDHGRAEALLIAAYGKGMSIEATSSCILEELP
ncbi:hypothetical protein K2173_008355 [Erythroxylum novogranatense]|uniref:Holliday junction resolvase MOC1, chloroplastic n=1 Tax=Erythroxylum novogranatense TaxID=1862640 RepID=A0AAV8TK57_9ROSI|nr:hypothetical protein K2173_008355 [Erythroxylum novogranatense]